MQNFFLKPQLKKILRFLLLLLFLGFYGSATLFPHSHIAGGVTIVHSHPYLPVKGKNPVNHQHTTNEYILIQLLSSFAATVTFITFCVETYKAISKVIVLRRVEQRKTSLIFLRSNGLRAPPVIISAGR